MSNELNINCETLKKQLYDKFPGFTPNRLMFNIENASVDGRVKGCHGFITNNFNGSCVYFGTEYPSTENPKGYSICRKIGDNRPSSGEDRPYVTCNNNKIIQNLVDILIDKSTVEAK